MKLDIETWTSDKGASEVHHFIAGTQTYVFGVNKDLLGDEAYYKILDIARASQGDDTKMKNFVRIPVPTNKSQVFLHGYFNTADKPE